MQDERKQHQIVEHSPDSQTEICIRSGLFHELLLLLGKRYVVNHCGCRIWLQIPSQSHASTCSFDIRGLTMIQSSYEQLPLRVNYKEEQHYPKRNNH